MIKHTNSDSTQSCINCTKNSNLIKKYQLLIKLYKKKQLQLSGTQSSRQRYTSHSLIYTSSSNSCIKLTQVLTDLVKQRYTPLFNQIKPKPHMKLLILNISNRIQKYVKKSVFDKLKTYLSINYCSVAKILIKKIDHIMKIGFTTIKEFTGNSVIQLIISDFANTSEQYDRKVVNNIYDINQIYRHTSSGKRWLQRRNIQLEIENKKLLNENIRLKKCIEEIVKRQSKQNQKKKDSLEMLAQQIYQKNQQIYQLKQSLKAYQDTYKPNNNILQDDIITMKKDIDHLQIVRQKLNNDLSKIMIQLQQTNKNFKIINIKNQQLEKQNNLFHKLSYQLNVKKDKFDFSHNQLIKLTKIVDKKIKKLNIYEKQLDQTRINNNQAIIKKQTQNIHQQLKSQIILLFLTNISQVDNNLLPQHLFTQNEINILNNHKDNWLKMINQSNSKQTGERTELIQDDFSVSQINIKGGNNMDSIFNALQSPRNPVIVNSMTMKLLQLQLQKSRQVQKISQIKQKLLHIRVIILKLLKSLQIQQGTKLQYQDILRVLFDLFQYSEQQRQSIFIKKKKLFGFI